MGAERLSVSEGLTIIRRETRPIGVETISVAKALGRVTSDAIFAKRAVPSFRTAAMDGFVVNSAETISANSADQIHLRVSRSIAAGGWPSPLPKGEAWGISTGAPMPENGDSIIIAERATLVQVGSHPQLIVNGPITMDINVRHIGEDVMIGDLALSPGVVVTPDAIGGLTAFGVETIAVRRPLSHL